jgi:DNA-binding beta-propeller fold protein YncE
MFLPFTRKRQGQSTARGSRRPGRKAHRQNQPRTRPAVEALEDRCLLSGGLSAPVADSLYVGDGSDNTVKKFDATTGAYQGNVITSGSGGLNGPRGLIFRNDGQLLVVDQNVGEPNPGEVLRFNGVTGNFLGNLVFQTDPNAPFAPRGMVLGDHHTLYVADDGNLDGITLGRLTRFNSETGAFLGDLQPTGFTGDFYPRGVVIGPDGLVYASVRNIAPTGGEVMRWDPATGNFLGSFVTSDATNDLNRPEGIVFGPDGNLYVASFRADATGTDKIEEFSGQTGAYLGKIDLDQVGQPRAFAQALLFGPGGHLFVPITGNGPDTGEVRRYDVSSGSFDVFVPPSGSGGPLGMPWYLTFGNTDAATLAYHTGRAPSVSGALDQVVAALAQPLSAPTAIMVWPTFPGSPQAGSVAPLGSSVPSVVATTSSVMPTASASPTGAIELLFAAWADDLLGDALLL